MLGGYAAQTADIDINESEIFLKSLFNLNNRKLNRAFDVGGGIGRVSKNLLQNYFHEIDLLD